jgi:hypothetical protein
MSEQEDDPMHRDTDHFDSDYLPDPEEDEWPESQSLLSRDSETITFPKRAAPHGGARARSTSDDSDDPGTPTLTSTPTPTLTSTPVKKNKFVHRRKTLVERPLTDDEIRSDSRYHLRTMFRLAIIDEQDPTIRHYQCLMCLPKKTLIWTSRTTNQHLIKHLKSLHGEKGVTKFDALALTKPKKRPASPTSSQSQSSTGQSVSRGHKEGRLSTPLHMMVYTQQDFEHDTLVEVVMNMLPFEVCHLLFFYTCS